VLLKFGNGVSCVKFGFFGRYAYPWWKEKIINSELKRKDGFCPLTPEETALTLRALDIDRDIQIYVAAGEIYGGQRRMAGLAASFPKLVSKNAKITILPLSDNYHFARLCYR